MWCIAKITPEYRNRMYKLLTLYARPYDEQFPVVCMDEKNKQLMEDVRGIIPLRPGSPAKYDSEYSRKGTCNIFVAVEPLAGKRKIKVTLQRKKSDFAHFVKDLITGIYRQAKKVRLVLDNLNTHFASSFYETFSKEQADMLLSKIEFCYTPKHASWLNMAEIEINMMDRECLNRRIGKVDLLKKEVECWTRQRNNTRKKINWAFTKKQADRKLSKYYVA